MKKLTLTILSFSFLVSAAAIYCGYAVYQFQQMVMPRFVYAASEAEALEVSHENLAQMFAEVTASLTGLIKSADENVELLFSILIFSVVLLFSLLLWISVLLIRNSNKLSKQDAVTGASF
jgi:hypothetical protein